LKSFAGKGEKELTTEEKGFHHKGTKVTKVHNGRTHKSKVKDKEDFAAPSKYSGGQAGSENRWISKERNKRR
jgi:hypothetical protein